MAQAAQNPGNKIHPFTHTYLYVYVYVNVCMPMSVKKFGNNFSVQVGFCWSCLAQIWIIACCFSLHILYKLLLICELHCFSSSTESHNTEQIW